MQFIVNGKETPRKLAEKLFMILGELEGYDLKELARIWHTGTDLPPDLGANGQYARADIRKITDYALYVSLEEVDAPKTLKLVVRPADVPDRFEIVLVHTELGHVKMRSQPYLSKTVPIHTARSLGAALNIEVQIDEELN